MKTICIGAKTVFQYNSKKEEWFDNKIINIVEKKSLANVKKQTTHM